MVVIVAFVAVTAVAFVTLVVSIVVVVTIFIFAEKTGDFEYMESDQKYSILGAAA